MSLDKSVVCGSLDKSNINRGFFIGGSDNSTLAANQTRYYNVYGGNDAGNWASTDIRVPFDCIISELRCDCTLAPGAGDTFTYTLMDEGGATTLTCQTVNPNIESQDLVNEVSLDEDDRISLRVVTSATAAAGIHKWSMKVVPTGA